MMVNGMLIVLGCETWFWSFRLRHDWLGVPERAEIARSGLKTGR
jgi:hypothetical protein